jgi:hypothetical protein
VENAVLFALCSHACSTYGQTKTKENDMARSVEVDKWEKINISPDETKGSAAR